MENGSKDINCPQCGNQLPLKFRYAKLTVCMHCDSTIFLEDQTAKLAGKQSVLADMPSLLQLGASFQYHTTSFVPIGMVRYAHEVGFWEEWWVLDSSGNSSGNSSGISSERGFWVSVDEGDFAFEKPLKIEQAEMPKLANLTLGKKISLWNDNWQVTEISVGKCVGFKGELPKIVHIDEKIPFVHLSGQTGQLITLEYLIQNDKPNNKSSNSKHSIEAFQGEWVDPFEIVTTST